MLLTFWQWRLSLFGAFLFSEKSFSWFQGVQPATMRAEACPKIAHSCFQLKWFALLGGCNILISGNRMSQNRAFLLSEKRFCRFGGMQSTILAQKRENIHADVLFLDILIFNLNVLPFWGDATLCAFSWHARMHKCMTPCMLTKKWKKSPCQIWQILSFCYHFWYHLENALLHTRKVGTDCRLTRACAKISCLNLANIIILVSLLLITFNKRNAPVGAFF